MSTVIIILLFLYSSYLTLEKYIVTGHIFRPRTSGKNTPETIKERSEQVAAEVSEGQELIGASRFRPGQPPTPVDYPGQALRQGVQPADHGVTFTGRNRSYVL